MSAGTAYSKRFPGGFVDEPTETTPIDQQFLNAVEAALLQILGAAPTADGQVAQWDNVNTRYVPALILNKNVDAAAAIAKSKIDLTGANGIVNADIAAAAAIARSKLNFGGGLVNADIDAAAAISISKIANALKVTVGTIAAGPPGGPATNDIWVATDVDTAGTVWVFRYNSAEATYKWEFIGGPPTVATINTYEGVNFNSTWGNLTTVGPTVTVARGGDYWCEAACKGNGGAGADTLFMGVANGNNTPADPLYSEVSQVGGGLWMQLYAQGVFASLAAAATPRMRYNGGNQVNNFSGRVLAVTPIRII